MAVMVFLIDYKAEVDYPHKKRKDSDLISIWEEIPLYHGTPSIRLSRCFLYIL